LSAAVGNLGPETAIYAFIQEQQPFQVTA